LTAKTLDRYGDFVTLAPKIGGDRAQGPSFFTGIGSFYRYRLGHKNF
jgi:hypothetical protein